MIWREQIYGALFLQLATLCAATNPDPIAQAEAVELTALAKAATQPFAFGTRRPAALGTLDVGQYPALVMLEKGEVFTRTLIHGPAEVTLVAHVLIQTAIGQDPNSIPATLQNDLADAVQEVVETGDLQFGEGANILVQNQLPQDGDASVFVCRVSGREVAYYAYQNQVFGEQDLEIEVIQTH